MIFAIPLAWLQLVQEKSRLLIALAGIAFAVILMFMQLGFRDALFDSNVRLHTHCQGDIFLLSSQSNALTAMKTFSQRRLYQALGVEGVESASPIYLAFVFWKNPETRRTRSILLIGFNPEEPVFNLPDVQQNLNQIKIPDTVLFDEASRIEFGPIASEFKQGKTIITEVRGRRITIGGLFKLGASFGADGNLITSDLNFLRIVTVRKAGLIDIGVIRLEPKANLQTTLNYLRTYLPKDIKVLSKKEFIEFEKNYWRHGTAIGFIFTLGTIMAFLVGTVIVYQILYTDVSNHLAEYATLKAMGYTNFYLFFVVFQEALILSILGYIPGFALCLGLYDLTRNATSLPIAMSLERSLTILLLSILMCSLSGAIALRKVQSADPAEIF
jgi:putative ABC transport system permease protein